MIVRTLFISLVLLGLAGLMGCQPESRALTKGEQPPAFQLQSLNGELANFPQDYKGKVVVIRFWADWCPFCESEMQSIEPVYQLYHDKGLVILALNVRQDRDIAAEFIEKLDISYPALLDKEGEVARAYGVIGLPTTFVVDREGRLHTRIIGESTVELFAQIVEALM
ncbi:MAG: TlpA disulfide reductase family protein [Candidatus Thiodiazotropha sp.]